MKKKPESEQRSERKEKQKLKPESKQRPEENVNQKSDRNSKQTSIVDEKSDSKHYIYILECADKTLYTGYTNNLEKRIATHQSGKGAKYTKTRLPVLLKYYEIFEDKESAMKREWFIKHKLTREEKLKLISSSNDLFQGCI
ncbi:MAG: GIY-YIG nuclease family protein [Lachnospiraceae bacterium]|nr:GIY-YIG nuclease family protein [Lachnospiraceae bacterium]